MSITNIIALLVGVALIGGIAWFFWGPRKSGQRAAVTSSGYQEAMVLVKGGYTPDVNGHLQRFRQERPIAHGRNRPGRISAREGGRV